MRNKNSMRARRRAAMKSPTRAHFSTEGNFRCKSFEPGCVVCARWYHLDKYGYFPRSFMDLVYYTDQLHANVLRHEERHLAAQAEAERERDRKLLAEAKALDDMYADAAAHDAQHAGAYEVNEEAEYYSELERGYAQDRM